MVYPLGFLFLKSNSFLLLNTPEEKQHFFYILDSPETWYGILSVRVGLWAICTTTLCFF